MYKKSENSQFVVQHGKFTVHCKQPHYFNTKSTKALYLPSYPTREHKRAQESARYTHSIYRMFAIFTVLVFVFVINNVQSYPWPDLTYGNITVNFSRPLRRWDGFGLYMYI